MKIKSTKLSSKMEIFIKRYEDSKFRICLYFDLFFLILRIFMKFSNNFWIKLDF